ncbi:MAG: ATP-binding protein [Candidatus Njordarchaeales archaeon]
MFIDREYELDFLEERYRSGRAELIIIYGRRGIGKTEIVKQFIRGKKAYYFFVTLEDLGTLLEGFLGVLGPPYDKLSVRGLEDFFEVLGDLASGERVVFVFDEFQRLLEVYRGALSLLQKVWDEKLRRTKIFLILVGSAVSVFERIGKSYESPIYGRRTGMLEISEMDYWAARMFFPRYDEESRLFAYSVLGGVPLYLSLFSDSKTVEGNIVDQILSRGSALYDEPEMLLLQETRDPTTYMSILKAISLGYTRFSEISDASGVEKNKLSKYLNVLINRLKLVERETPIKERGRGIYKIRNNFIRFWLRYVLPNKSLLEIGEADPVLRRIIKEKHLIISHGFESVVKQFLLRINGSRIDNIPIRFDTIGRWWRRDIEIDLVAINEREKIAYFVECKYTNRPVSKKVLLDLMRKSEEFTWKKNVRKNIYMIFSKEGFSFPPEEDVILIDLTRMLKIANEIIKIRVIK